MFEEKTINALKWIIEILNRKNILYKISGGFSAKLYGSPRTVNDIDIDIPEGKFTEIIEEVKPYITLAPGHYQDGKWDMQLMTLNYNGQEIDIGGAESTKISNKERTEWIAVPTDFSRIKKVEVEGITLNVILPEDLIKYKQHLDGEHQLIDIEAAKNYLNK